MSVEGLEGVLLTLSGCLDREADESNALVCGAAMGRWLRWRCLRWVHTLSPNTPSLSTHPCISCVNPTIHISPTLSPTLPTHQFTNRNIKPINPTPSLTLAPLRCCSGGELGVPVVAALSAGVCSKGKGYVAVGYLLALSVAVSGLGQSDVRQASSSSVVLSSLAPSLAPSLAGLVKEAMKKPLLAHPEAAMALRLLVQVTVMMTPLPPSAH